MSVPMSYISPRIPSFVSLIGRLRRNMLGFRGRRGMRLHRHHGLDGSVLPCLEPNLRVRDPRALPCLLGDINAIRDRLHALASLETIGVELEIYTASRAAILDLRRVVQCTTLAACTHAIMDRYSYPVCELWIRRDMHPARIAADRACHRRGLPRPLPFLPVSTVEELLVEKEKLRSATRA